MASPGWPATLHEGRVALRPLRMRDAARWTELRLQNEEWLAPWDGRPPGSAASWAERSSHAAFGVMVRVHRREAKAGRCLPFGVLLDGELVGQVTVSNVVRGALQGASIGYWVSRHVAGQGVMPTAVALVVDHAFTAVGLHRIEVCIRPENEPSLRVVRKLGLREEGLAQRFLWIDEGWRDHLVFAVTAEEVPDGLLERWRASRRA